MKPVGNRAIVRLAAPRGLRDIDRTDTINFLKVKNGNPLVFLFEDKDVPPVPFDDIDSVLQSLCDIYEDRFCSQVGAVIVALLMWHLTA